LTTKSEVVSASFRMLFRCHKIYVKILQLNKNNKHSAYSNSFNSA